MCEVGSFHSTHIIPLKSALSNAAFTISNSVKTLAYSLIECFLEILRHTTATAA